MRMNSTTTRVLLGSAFKAAAELESHDRKAFYRPRGNDFRVLVYGRDAYTIIFEPSFTPRVSRISIVFLNSKSGDSDYYFRTAGEVDFVYSVPIASLCGPRHNFHLYNISFAFSKMPSNMDAGSFEIFQNGYYGITGRNPLERFREHHADAMAGRGHMLHKAWNQLVRNSFDFCPIIRIAGCSDTIDQIYDAEEKAVAGTLTPLGLNVIPGGRAGIRFLHNLRAFDNPRMVTPVERDAALCELENRRGRYATHYRSGHFRKLSSGKETWVRPCWVNLEAETA